LVFNSVSLHKLHYSYKTVNFVTGKAPDSICRGVISAAIAKTTQDQYVNSFLCTEIRSHHQHDTLIKNHI